MTTYSGQDRVPSEVHLPRASLVCLLLLLSSLWLLACGSPSSPPETANPTEVILSTARTSAGSPTPQIIATLPTPSSSARPIPTRNEPSPLPTPTTTGSDPSPIPTPTAPPPPTVTAGTRVESIPTYTYRIVQTFPHDPEAYTQGLVFQDGIFYEGTGLHGQSTLRRVDPQSGVVLQRHALPQDLFGEGITLWQDRIIQLTWQEQIGLVYDQESFELLDTFRYPTEGWGITHDGTRLIMSDGTSILRFWDPETFQEVGSVEVVGQNGPVIRLNELEYVEGLVYANVYQTDLIAMIEPDTGRVTGWIDLTGILGVEIPSGSGNVLNGIAYNEPDQRLFVTGKRWPRLFEIELLPLPVGD